MFRANKELSRLQDKVDEACARTVEPARQVRDLNEENLQLYREKKDLCKEKQDLINVLETISQIATSNTYGHAEAILGKINELSTINAKQYR